MLVEVRNCFAELGYHPIVGDMPKAHSADVWYQTRVATADVTQVLLLQYKPRTMAYSVSVGVSSPAARVVLLSPTESVLSKYLHPTMVSGWGLSRRPCWTLFDAGSAFDGAPFTVPEAENRTAWRDQVRRLVSQLLEPVFWPIRDAGEIQKLLLRNDGAFEWWRTNTVLRTAEVIATGKVADSDWHATRSGLLLLRREISRDMHGSKDPEELIDAIASAIHS